MRTMLVLTTAILLLVTCVAPAFAADAADGKKPTLLDIDMYALIASIIVFVVLLVVLSKTAWKPILAGLKQREDTIQGALDEAKAANEQARDLIAQYESKLEAARQEAAAIADEARRDAQDIKAQIEATARKNADETVARAKVEIDQAAAKAWDGIVRDAASIATEAPGRIVAGKPSPEGHPAIGSGVVSDFAKRRATAGNGSA